MPVSYSNTIETLQRFLAGFVILTMLLGAVPVSVLAQEVPPDPVLGCMDSEANNFNNEATEDDGSCTYDPEPVLGCMDSEATNYNNEATEDDGTCEYAEEETGTSTDSGTDETNTGTSTATSTDDGTENDGVDGDTGTSTATSTATTTDDGTGEEGGEGEGGEEGDGGEEGEGGDSGDSAEEQDEGEPVPVVAESDIGDDNSPEDGEGMTGGIYMAGRNITIDTGPATAQGEIHNDINSNFVISEFDPSVSGQDLDVYTFNATGTNEAEVSSEGVTFASTGDNEAVARGVANTKTGTAISALNIANVINSNIINSEGYLYLKNQIMEPHQSLDLSDMFFPDGSDDLGLTGECNLTSCAAEDVVYNFTQTSRATVTNEATVDAETGYNYAEGDLAEIRTGDAHAGANVINVVNTNIIDSNYRFLTYNAIGDLDGDLLLPTNTLFQDFFSRPNALTRLEDPRDGQMNVGVDNLNEATVENNVESYAETGLNDALASFDNDITTGRAESESNVLNKINQNIYGGDNMYLLIRVHGTWSGDIVGLPDGLAWTWTPDGILIYNEGAEIAPSKFIPYDSDSYTANFNNDNEVLIENNLNISAVTGMNTVDGLVGVVNTGNAFASANVMNVANTNVIGTNWTYAVINIFGDFDGDVTFAETDLTLSGSMSSGDDPLVPGSALTFSYTVANSSPTIATNVTLTQTLQNAFASGTDNHQTVSLGSIQPGGSKTVTLEAFVDPDLPYGSSSVTAVANVDSDEGDSNQGDNTSLLFGSVLNDDPNDDSGTTTDDGSGGGGSGGGGSGGGGGGVGTTTDDGTGTTTDDGTGTTTDDGTGTTTDDGTDDDDSEEETETNNNSGGGGGGGGGGGRTTNTKSIERDEGIELSSLTKLTIRKEATADEDDTVTAGEVVDYKITVLNGGAEAYDAVVYDTLTNPIGSVVDEQSWKLGTILAGEKIELTYSTQYSSNTPSGLYTNTASIEAYGGKDSKAEGKDPLEVDDAVHTINVKGKSVGIGNVEVFAFARLSPTNIAAIITWETTKATDGQIFYEPKGLVSPYNSSLPNYGFETAGMRLPALVTKHFSLIFNLKPGETYTYRIRSTNGKDTVMGGDYTLVVPGGPATPTKPQPQVAGTQVSAQTTTYTPPPPPPAPAPAPEPEPEPEPEPQQTSTSSGIGGFVKNAAKKVFGLF